MESIHEIYKEFLTYNDSQDITTHQCLVDVIKFYSDHIAVHLNVLKERILEEYQRMYELKMMPTARFTLPQATDTSSVTPNAPPVVTESFGERAMRLFNERAAAIALRDHTTMEVATRPAAREQLSWPDTCIDAVLYNKLKTPLEVIFVSGLGEFIFQYQFNKLDNRMSKLENGQTITKTSKEKKPWNSTGRCLWTQISSANSSPNKSQSRCPRSQNIMKRK